MRINTNLSMLSSINNLSNACNTQLNSSVKLSSGSKIYNSKNNSAGLSISEKMKSQIRGLSQATKNSQDGISLIQTVSGSLDETHNILQRMRELSVQSADGSYTDDDRTNIQSEINQLLNEIDHISNNTEFNTLKLLKENSSSSSISVSYETHESVMTLSLNEDTNNTLPTSVLSEDSLASLVSNINHAESISLYANTQTVYSSLDQLRAAGLVTDVGNNKTIVNLSGNVKLDNINLTSSTIHCAAGTHLTLNNSQITTSDQPFSGIVFNGSNNYLTIEGNNRVVSGYGASAINVSSSAELTIQGSGFLRAEGNQGSAGIGGGSDSTSSVKGLHIQIGANAGNSLFVDISTMNTSELGLTDISVSTQ